MPSEAVVPLEETTDVLLLCSRSVRRFAPQVYLQELAFAIEMAARNRVFAVTDDASVLSDKAVAWFLPNRFISPQLWDYSRQVYEFASGLERQGNRLFCSAHETAFWENKAHMHQRLDDAGVPTPKTRLLTRENWSSTAFDIQPALIKQEHSAGSSGIRYFATADDARTFVSNYRFRPTESLIMQEVVAGATRDLRLTLVADAMIQPATYWRQKTANALSRPEWTTTATTYGSQVRHAQIPESVGPLAAEYLRRLQIRTAGIDLIWSDDDLSRDPLFLELSPYYQPNPPKPMRYEHWTYKEFKAKPYAEEGYFFQQFSVFREIYRQVLDQGLH
jgi:glutathione synthase/RimK-type ligase-like ATP-grasp enzyme